MVSYGKIFNRLICCWFNIIINYFHGKPEITQAFGLVTSEISGSWEKVLVFVYLGVFGFCGIGLEVIMKFTIFLITIMLFLNLFVVEVNGSVLGVLSLGFATIFLFLGFLESEFQELIFRLLAAFFIMLPWVVFEWKVFFAGILFNAIINILLLVILVNPD